MFNSEDGFETDAERPITVSELNLVIKETLQNAIPKLWVEGEIGDLSRPSSGHLYFSLKDDQSQIRAVMWKGTAARLGFQLEDGQAVLVQGAIDVYPPRGTYQLIVTKIEPKGVGSLQLRLKQLHDKLRREGLFELDRKRPLPRFPKRVGFVTSPSGAALKDFLEVARRRWQAAEIIVIPARVQGEGSIEDLVAGIRVAQLIEPALDVLVVGRGGGSIEDLWSFNEEAVCRAISKSKIPTVSAVGHEVDVTLADLVADVRALTPSEAAERVFPNREEIVHRLSQHQQRLQRGLQGISVLLKRRLDDLANRPVLRQPHDLIKVRMQMLDQLELRGQRAIGNRVRLAEASVQKIAAAMEALSPLRVLARGYSITQERSSSELVKRTSDVSVGDEIQTIVQDGLILSRVEKLEKK